MQSFLGSADVVSSSWRDWSEWDPHLCESSTGKDGGRAGAGSAKESRNLRKSKAATVLTQQENNASATNLKYSLPNTVERWHSHKVTIRTVDAQLGRCSWAMMHNVLDVIALGNTTKHRNSLKLMAFQYDPSNTTECRLDVRTSTINSVSVQ